MKALLKILFCFLTLISITYGSTTEKVNDFLVKAYAQKYNIDKTDVYLKINHLPDVNITDQSLQLVNKFKSLDLGFNRATIQIIRNGQVLSQHQLTYSAKIEKNIPVLKRIVKFGESVTSADLELEKRMLKYNYQQFYTTVDLPEGMVAKALLRKGDILKKTDVRVKPTVNRGQQVDLKVKSGSILIEMDGITKEEGHKGEKIRVYNQTTRRHYFGIVESPQTVVINLD